MKIRRKKKRKTTYIYEIRAGKYYYIGKSNSPWLRFEAHRRKAINNLGKNTRKNLIFRKNLHKLQMRVIEKPKMSHWRQREVHWIAHYRQKYGYDRILNASDGGDGSSGGGWDDDGPGDFGVSPLYLIPLAFFLCLCGNVLGLF